ISRAVHLCESTLAFGRAEEPPPALDRVMLASVIDDVVDSERLAASDKVDFGNDVLGTLMVRADPEQLYRVLSNLVRNARQAIEASGREGRISISAEETETAWRITVADTGPGLPPKAQEHLFTPFQGGIRKGGSGLGLAIAAELVRGHGGALTLKETGQTGTTFEITLPKGVVLENQAAE
ncbi:MAG: HAMP domain-containing sensor histidine kinase, partial [Myxococcota bacterium]